MPSFDIVSELELEEVRNAVDIAKKELETRFDFRGVEASFSWDAQQKTVKLITESDFQLEQMMDILRNKLTKRGVDVTSMERQDVQRSGKTFQLLVQFKHGIEADVAKKVAKTIKESKVKVQASIQGEQVRVTGKKRDDLQSAMALVKQANLGQPFQFKNFRD